MAPFRMNVRVCGLAGLEFLVETNQNSDSILYPLHLYGENEVEDVETREGRPMIVD